MTETELHLPPPRAWVGPLLLLAGGVFIGLAPIGLRLGLDHLGPQAIAFWRYVFAIPLLFILLVAIERRMPARINGYVVLAGTFFALDIALWHWGLTLTTVANATFIVNLGNVCVGFIAWLFLKEKPKPIWFAAVLVAVIGAAALSLGGEPGGKSDIRGDVLAIGAAIMVSGYMLCSKLARNRLGAMDVIFWLTVVEAVVAGFMVIISGESFMPPAMAGFVAPAFLALAAQIGGQGLIIAGLGRTPAAIAGIIVLIQPVVAAAISWQLFDESLTAIQGGGAALILFGIWMSQRRPRRRPAAPESKPLQDAVRNAQ
ncbi:DMT family transporter [Henriciella mobilis]|uniref:DMT family transporter n=1 Tax=Henriciella mobilis TaxID=2305467 RepID=UPI000E66B7DD|nr:DMT family transporter [Henriciella mobilis]RIJ17811.1 DMT family transporter [Henriciella mobilis]RIJ25376.1 DMT family transporter [Henriciella mobilis]